MKSNKALLIPLFIIFLSISVVAYNVNINWTFNQNNYDVELYRCTNSICNNYNSQLINAISPGYTYNMFYTAEGTQYHAAFFYKACYRPNGYIVTTSGQYSTSFSDNFVKKNYCQSEIDPLIVTVTQSGSNSTITITSDVKSAFTVSDDAAGSPKFYPESHRSYFTSDIKVQMLVDNVLKSEQTIQLYQDTKQTVTFQLDKSTLTPGLHVIKIQTDPIDCICNQSNKIIKYRTVEIQIEQPANTPPVIEGLPDRTINEDTGYWDALIDLWAYSHDNETPDNGLTFTVTSQTNNGIVDCIVDHNRYIDCATLPNRNGYSDVTVRVTDPQGLYDEDTFRVNVLPVNDPPVVSQIPDQTINSCQQFTPINLDNYVNDVDNTDEQITWSYSGNVHLSVNINTQRIATITYPSWFRGSETIRFRATDPEGLYSYDDVTFTVTECQQPPQNTPPTIENIPDKTLIKNSGLNSNLVNLWAYAHDNETTVDQLTYTITLQSNTSAVSCTIRNNRYIDCTVQPNMLGHSDIRVRVTDPQGLYDEDTFRISVAEAVKTKDPEVAPSIQITRVIYDDRVKQDDYLHIDIYVQGNKIKDTKARITIPELGINDEFNRLNNIEIKIPKNTKTGQYTMQVSVKSNKNEEDKVYRQFFVESLDDLSNGNNPNEGKDNKTSGSVTNDEYKKGSEMLLSIIAVALTIILIVILVLIIGVLTAKK